MRAGAEAGRQTLAVNVPSVLDWSLRAELEDGGEHALSLKALFVPYTTDLDGRLYLSGQATFPGG